MAFHVACPITCKRICFCTLGFPRSVQRSNERNDFVHDVVLVEEFLKDPWGKIRVSKEESTVQVLVPGIPQAPPAVVVDGPGGGVDAAKEAAAAVSAQSKRVALQRKAATSMVAAEDYALRFESGDVAPASKEIDGEEQGQSNANVMCRLCFVGENGGSERARRMLSCKSCGKKYHRNCLKNWAQNRDLFHWSSWKCPSCRICEICRRTGDPNKFMFCRRCDAAYHCYCQHPPHKNVSSGPYLCPKHTKCHSCGSNVPGNGLSLRWFLGYTCCDACGRLFVKGNYCPVCLKVYRDSESTPMVCCDVCQRWVHCQCDDISDEKYMQFQVDGNLQYSCPTCRGECYQVRDLEDAVRELWRRKDMADKDLVASLRAAAGLPTEDEIFSLCSYSDDEENGPEVLKNEFGRSLKLSLKGDKLPKKAKEHGKKGSSKKYSKKKGYKMPLSSKTECDQSFEGHHDVHSHGNSFGDDMHTPKVEGHDISSSFAGVASYTEGVCSMNQLGVLKHKYVDEVMASDDNKISRVKFKTSKPHDLDSGEDDGKHVSKSKIIKAKKLVINLGARKINVTNSPRSDASSCQREQDLMTSNGIEDTSLQKMNSKFVLDHRCESRHGKAKLGDGDRVDHASQGLKIAGRGGNVIKFGRVRQEVSKSNTKVGSESSADGREPDHMHVLSGKRDNDRSRAALGKQLESRPNASGGSNDDAPVLQSLAKDSKPSLKLKFRKLENQNSQVPQPEEEKSLIKGQRSKRKRPSSFMEKISFNEDEDEDATQSNQGSLMNEIMDANWILKKLGKDSIGKRVEVHQPSDNSWHKGVVSDTVEGTSALAITLDNGRMKTLELGKQGVRFVPQKKKRSKS